MPLPIQGRPEFGNPAHIEAIKKAVAQEDFNALPKCLECLGERDCSKCGAECMQCDGTGKDSKAYAEWKEKYPGRWPDFR